MTSTVIPRVALMAALCSGCSLFGGGPSTTPGTPPPDTSSTRTEAYAASSAEQCAQSVTEAEAELGKALALARGETPGPDGSALEPSGVLLQKIRALKIDVTLKPAAAPDGTVAQSILLLHDSLGDEAKYFMEHPPRTAKEKRKLQRYTQKATKGVAVVNQFRFAITDVGISFLSTNIAAQSCHASAVQMATFTEQMRRVGTPSVRPNDALERAAFAQLASEAARADALASATMGLVATYQATVNDGRDPAILDDAVADVSAALAEPSAATDGAEAEVDALLAGAKAAVDLAEADAAAKAQLEQAATAPPRAATAPAALIVRNDRLDKVKAVVAAATSAASGDWGGAVSSAAALLPEGSPLHHAMAGAGAIVSGNYLGAVEAAAKLARSRPRLASAMDKLKRRLQR